jgi:hypothetical protein
LLRAEKLVKKARRARLHEESKPPHSLRPSAIGRKLFALAVEAQRTGHSAEDLLRAETKRREMNWRKQEKVWESRARRSTLDKNRVSSSLRSKRHD